MAKKVVILIVDPQIDFCSPDGALFVPGADKDMERLAMMIKRTKDKTEAIYCSLDSHRLIHIGHPIWWLDENGKHLNPFTIVSKDDVCGKNPKYRAYNPAYQKWSEQYVTKLSENGRYPLCIWPPHCLISSKGWGVQPVLFEALCEWEQQFATVDYIPKGSNIKTEHYSIFQADVVDDEDPGTMLNTKIIKEIQGADIVGIAGEASSHCVANSVLDLANNFGDANIKKMVFLKDCSSPVPGFEKQAEDFIKSMVARGMQISTSVDFLK
jgi:nicotinamidase/pyrazinamidase